MSNWGNFTLTKKGQKLYAKLGTGSPKLLFTKAKIGSGTLSDPYNATDLAEPKQNIPIDAKSATADGTTRLHCIITNDNLAAGFYIRELGVYAQDPDDGEILMYVASDLQPDYLPPESATAVAQVFNIDLAISGLTVVDVSFDHIQLIKQMLNVVYPVGSIYVTSQNVNPGTLFGVGTWRKITDRVIVAAGNTFANGETGGELTFTISLAQLPSHKHALSSDIAGAHSHTATIAEAGSHIHSATINNAGVHTHSRGTMNITGSLGPKNSYAFPKSGVSGAFYTTSNPNTDGRGGGSSDSWDNWYFDASRSWTGATSSDGNHTHTANISSAASHKHTASIDTAIGHNHNISMSNTGEGAPISFMPPYIVKYIWERVS